MIEFVQSGMKDIIRGGINVTHTNHRQGNYEELSKDYIVLIMPARGINNTGQIPKLQELFLLLMEYEPINAGAQDIGTILTNTVEQITDNISDETTMIHGVYDDLDVVNDVVDAIKAKDIGFSVVVVGLLDEVNETEETRGIKRHSVHYSLGVLGRTDLLPPSPILKIVSMCGHGFVTEHLIESVLTDLKAKRITIKEGAKLIGKHCVCGIFNYKQAEGLLEKALCMDNVNSVV